MAGRPKGSKNSPSKKRKQAMKDPNKPKRPTSAYFYFIASKREENKAAGKHVSKVAEWTKEMSEIWRELTDSERKPFDKLAATDKSRYTTEMAKYKGIDADKPKRPQSSYFLFLADFRVENKDKYEENKELLRGAGEAWKALTPAQKKPYEAGAAEGKKKYAAAMSEYAANGGGKAKKAKVAPAAAAKNGKSDDDEEDDDEEEEDDDEEEDEDSD